MAVPGRAKGQLSSAAFGTCYEPLFGRRRSTATADEHMIIASTEFTPAHVAAAPRPQCHRAVAQAGFRNWFPE